MVCFPAALVCGLTGIAKDVRKGPAIAVAAVAGVPILLWALALCAFC